MDYKQLLTKYMRHVRSVESICYLRYTNERVGPFTKEELDELKRIRDHLQEELDRNIAENQED